MSTALVRARVGAATLRRRAQRRLAPPRPRTELVAEHAAGRSFADGGAMWSVDGAVAFAAEAAGASSVSALDVMAPTPAYLATHAQRGSRVRFVQGDLHDEATLAELGAHDVVWCSGVLYHAPHPLLTLERLRSVTTRTLLLATETIPEVPGAPSACLFAPPPGTHPAHRTPFAADAGYRNWYWALTASAVRAMLAATGFTVTTTEGDALHRTFVAEARA
jgi:hypothetical protein